MMVWQSQKSSTISGAENDINLDKRLLPLHKLYGEDYRKQKLQQVKDDNVMAMTLFGMWGGSFALFILTVLWLENVSVAGLMTVYCICSFIAGESYLVHCWMKSKKEVKFMQIETVYAGAAQVIATRPLTVQYLLPDETVVIKQVSSQVKSIFKKGVIVKIVVENDTIVKVEPEKMESSNIQSGGRWTPYKGQRFGKEMINVAKVILIIMIIGIIGWIYCFVKYPYMIVSMPRTEVREEEYKEIKIITMGSVIRWEDLEKELLFCLEEKVDEFLGRQFPKVDERVLENVKEVCAKKVKSIQNLASYEILKRETRDYEKYTVRIEVTPTNVFQTLQDNFEEIRREKVELETYEDVSQMYVDIVEESIQRSIEGNVYGEKQVIEVIVRVSGDECEMEASDWEKVIKALFPQ